MSSPLFELFRRRRAAVLIDDLGKLDRGALVAPGEGIDASHLNQLLTLTGGHPFVALSAERVQAFGLESMTRPRVSNAVSTGEAPPFEMCLSVEAREGVSTGISAFDRAATIRILAEADPNPRKLVKPGHIVPVSTRPGGILVKNTLPEGALDLVRIAGFNDAALFLELLGSNGEQLTGAQCRDLARVYDYPAVTLSELLDYRLRSEVLVEKVAEAQLPTHAAGMLRALIFRSCIHEGDHLALIKGTLNPEEPVLTRVQAEYTFADVFGGSHPGTRSQLHRSLRAIGQRGSGVLVYLRRPSSGELREQISAWETKASERPAAMMREYGMGAQILRALGIRKLELITTTTRKLVGITSFGIEIVSELRLDEQGEITV